MKKSIILSVIALALTIAPFQATNALDFEKVTLAKIENPNPFHLSIVKGDIETVKKLIELGTDVNKRWNGKTPAMYAAKYNKVEILELLVAHGANLKARSQNGISNVNGQTAYDFAKSSNAKEAMQYLSKALGKRGS